MENKDTQILFFFFSSRRRHTRCYRDWSSDVCSSDLYVGDGGTSFGTGRRDEKGQSSPLDRGETRMDEATLRRIHLPGYRTAIEAGVGSIMPSYSSWNGVKCSGSRRLLTEILKEELGFEGFVISDYDAIDELPGDYRSDIKQS